MNALFPPDLAQLSRRAFLRQAQRGLLGLFLLPLLERTQGKAQAADGETSSEQPPYGRALDNQLAVYDQPSFSARLINMYWHDLVFPINGVTIGDSLPAHNRVWYMVNDGAGYVHSGGVQPAAVRHNPPLESVPEEGALVEVTVPYTDAIKQLNRPERTVYRLYYSSLHWVKSVSSDQQQRKWYLIADDKYKVQYYVRAEHVYPLKAEDVAPLSSDVPAEDKRLEVRLSEQVVIAYEADRAVFMAQLASGARFARGDFSTPSGGFITNRKRPSRHMASGDLAAPGSFDLPGVPWVSYLTQRGISFHGTYWHNDFGKPRSHGCLNLSPQAARWVYRWTTPTVPLHARTWGEADGTFVAVLS
jgi:lipoprotein-anchoring transpeptidase ErfK/SrfK